MRRHPRPARTIFWVVAPPLAYLLVSIVLFRLGYERAFFTLSYPGFFFFLVFHAAGHGGPELVVLPNLALHLLVGAAASFMGTPARRALLYLGAVTLAGAAAAGAERLELRLSHQHNAYVRLERAWRERIPKERRLLAERDFDRAVRHWDSYCEPEIRLLESLSRTPACPSAPRYDFENAARLAADDQERIRCIADLYLAVLSVFEAKGAQAQAGFARWERCKTVEKSERTARLEKLYARYLDASLKRERLRARESERRRR